MEKIRLEKQESRRVMKAYIAFRKPFLPFAAKAIRQIVVEHCASGHTHVVVDIQSLFCSYRPLWLDDTNTELIQLFKDNVKVWDGRELMDDKVMNWMVAELIDELRLFFPGTNIKKCDSMSDSMDVRIDWGEKEDV